MENLPIKKITIDDIKKSIAQAYIDTVKQCPNTTGIVNSTNIVASSFLSLDFSCLKDGTYLKILHNNIESSIKDIRRNASILPFEIPVDDEGVLVGLLTNITKDNVEIFTQHVQTYTTEWVALDDINFLTHDFIMNEIINSIYQDSTIKDSTIGISEHIKKYQQYEIGGIITVIILILLFFTMRGGSPQPYYPMPPIYRR